MADSELATSDVMEALIQDPVKKKLLLQLLFQNKEAIEEYKRQNTSKTTLKKKIHCESPTALQRRRALEKLNQQNGFSSDSSEQSEISVDSSAPKLPFERLLEGVTAFVDVKRDSVNRSEGIKAVMRLMGAVTKDEFTNDVTHVIFKDGSFTTYQKAKLMKVHLVSVLWLDAVRRTSTRVPEKKYPAFGSNILEEQNVSVICSQLQRDYEDIIRDEKRKTATFKTPKNKRHTMAAPLTSKITQDLFSEEDQEFNSKLIAANNISLDDSDCGMVDGESSNRHRNSSIITNDLSDGSAHKENSSESNIFTSFLPKSKNKRQTINVISDRLLTPPTAVSRANANGKRSEHVLRDSNCHTVANTSTSSDRTKSGLDKLDLKLTVTHSSKSSVETTMSSLRLSESARKNCLVPEKNTQVTKTSNRRREVEKCNNLHDSDLNASLHKSEKLQKVHRNASFSSSEGEEVISNGNVDKTNTGGSPSKKQRIEKRTRKLYNPEDGAVLSPVHSDVERRELLEKKSKARVNVDLNKKNTKDSVVEERELSDILPDKMNKPLRQSERLSLSQVKPKYVFPSFNSSSSLSVSGLHINPIQRRSSLDFQTITETQQRRIKNNVKRNCSIVCTKMHRPETLNFQKVVGVLGNFFVENQVSDKTTHLVAGEWKRTINMLRALARGCWILKHEWLLKSKEQGRWLPEEDYEVTEFSPAVQRCRLERQAFGPKYRMDIFKNCGLIYVAKDTSPKQKDLQELITTCQGKITRICKKAAVVVGEQIQGEICVSELWVLDSITFNKLKSFKNYLLSRVNSPNY